MGGLVIAYAVFRGLAVVNVPMPARDAERDALVRLLFGGVGAGREHHTLELVFLLRSSAVEQSCWLAGVEMQVRLPSIGVAYEVILRLLEFRIRDDISIEQSLAIVLVALDGCLHFGGPRRGHPRRRQELKYLVELNPARRNAK